MIGLHDCDNTGFPNLALMKISGFYKRMGYETELYKQESSYDIVYSSKVFTYNPDTAPHGVLMGGYGRGITETLHDTIEHGLPDYDLYGIDYSMGFLTRGCVRKCEHCFVPDKEGSIVAHADYREFVIHNRAVFMDNNVLAIDHGLRQIELLGNTGIKIDFNQGLDSLYIDNSIAKLLSKIKWLSPLRLACDSDGALQQVVKAITTLRWHNVTPSQYSCYLLVKDIDSAIERVRVLKGMRIDPFAQPYIDKDGNPPTREQRRFARWVNTKQLFRSVTWEEYKELRGDNI